MDLRVTPQSNEVLHTSKLLLPSLLSFALSWHKIYGDSLSRGENIAGEPESLLTSSEIISPAPQREQVEQAGLKTGWIMGSSWHSSGGKLHWKLPWISW